MNRREMIIGTASVATTVAVPVVAEAANAIQFHETDGLQASHYLLTFHTKIGDGPNRVAGIRFDEDGRLVYDGNIPPDEAASLFLQHVANSGWGQEWRNNTRVA